MTQTVSITLPYPPPESRFFRVSCRGQRMRTAEADAYIYLARITAEGQCEGLVIESVSLAVFRPTWRQGIPAQAELVVLLDTLGAIGIDCTGRLEYAPIRVCESDPRVELLIQGKEST